MDNIYQYLKASNGNGDAPVCRIAANRVVGATTFTIDPATANTDRIPSFLVGTTGTLLPSGFIDPTTKTEFVGRFNYGTKVVTIDSYLPGSADIGNFENQVFIIRPGTHMANSISDFVSNMTGSGTPEDITTTGIVVTDKFQADSFLYTPGGSTNGKLLNGLTDPTYRHTFTGGEFTTPPLLVFPHGLSFTPKVQARWASLSGGDFHKMPYTAISNINYFDAPSTSLNIFVYKVDLTNIYVAVGIHDGIGLSIMSSNYQMVFQFFCTRFLDGAN